MAAGFASLWARDEVHHGRLYRVGQSGLTRGRGGRKETEKGDEAPISPSMINGLACPTP